jgi:chromosome segregation ATPase
LFESPTNSLGTTQREARARDLIQSAELRKLWSKLQTVQKTGYKLLVRKRIAKAKLTTAGLLSAAANGELSTMIGMRNRLRDYADASRVEINRLNKEAENTVAAATTTATATASKEEIRVLWSQLEQCQTDLKVTRKDLAMNLKRLRKATNLLDLTENNLKGVRFERDNLLHQSKEDAMAAAATKENLEELRDTLDLCQIHLKKTKKELTAKCEGLENATNQLEEHLQPTVHIPPSNAACFPHPHMRMVPF